MISHNAEINITASNAEQVTMHGALSGNEKPVCSLVQDGASVGGFLGQKAKTEGGPSESLPETPHYLHPSPE